jgi:hypothetical protein
MHNKPAINMFTINLPVKDHLISVMLCLFCGDPSRNNKGKFSYSIVGRVTGINSNCAVVEILSDYGRSDKLKDQLLFVNSQFIYSNQSSIPAILDTAIRLKGMLPWGEIIEVCFNIKLRYTLQRLFVNGIKSEYVLKNMSKSGVLLLQ